MSKEPEGFEDFWDNDISFAEPTGNTHYACAKQAWLKCAERKDKEIEALKAENAALRGFAQEYLEELINDCSYRNEAKEIVYQDYIICLKHVLKVE